MMEIAALALYLLLAAGIVLVILGLRGRAMFSLPRCSRCGYDLRGANPEVCPACPECGNDISQPKGVSFGKRQRRPRLIWTGAILSFVPLALIAGQLVGAYFGYSWRDLQSNASLISGLSRTAGQPWDWFELEKRMRMRRLTDEEVAAAIDQLIAFLGSTPGGYGQPLHWADRFVTAAQVRGAISEAQFRRLAESFYGNTPRIQMRTRAKAGSPAGFELQLGSTWSLGGRKLVKALRRVTIDGRECTLFDSYSQPPRVAAADDLSGGGSETIRGRIGIELPPGKYQASFEVDAGLLPTAAAYRTGSGNPGQAKRWPSPRLQWTYAANVPIEVVAPNEPVVAFVTDPSRDPGQEMTVTAGLAEAHSTTISLNIHYPAAQVAVASVLTVRIGGREYPQHEIVLQSHNGGISMGTAAEVPGLAPDVRTIDLVLRPSAKAAEREPQLDEIWGKPIIITGIPLDRPEDAK